MAGFLTRCVKAVTMTQRLLLLLAASAMFLGGCVTADSDNSPKPNAAKGRGMSSGMEAQTSTGAPR